LKHKSPGKSAAVVAWSFDFMAQDILEDNRPGKPRLGEGTERDNGGTTRINP
jgi:hypothetical protein